VPELPEVETVRLGLNQGTLDQSIIGGEILLAHTIAYPSANQFIPSLKGLSITTWRVTNEEKSDYPSETAQRSQKRAGKIRALGRYEFVQHLLRRLTLTQPILHGLNQLLEGFALEGI
jgi:hypothetical protein